MEKLANLLTEQSSVQSQEDSLELNLIDIINTKRIRGKAILNVDPQNTTEDTIIVDYTIDRAEAYIQKDTYRVIRNTKARAKNKAKRQDGSTLSKRYRRKLASRAQP